MFHSRGIRSGAVFCAALLLVCPSFAQSDSSPASATEAEVVKLSPFEVEEEQDRGYIASNSVGATKINTPLEDIPSSVIVLTRNLIDDVGPFKPIDVLKYASGITENFNTSDRYVLRGQMSQGFFRDGFMARFIRSDFNNVQQIEVLKGVQGVLYGSVGLNGMINLVSKTPAFQRMGEINVSVGDGNYMEGMVDYNDTLSAKTAYRVVLGTLEDEPQVFDDLHNERSSAYFALTHRFNRTVSFTGLVEYVHVDESLLGGTWFDTTTGAPLDGGKHVRRNSSIAKDSRFTDDVLRVNGRLDMEIARGWNARITYNQYTQETKRRQTDSRFSLPSPTGEINRVDVDYLTEGDFADIAADITGEFNTGAVKNRVVLGGMWHKYFNYDTFWAWNIFPANINQPDSALPPFGQRAPYWFTQVSRLRSYDYGAYILNTSSLFEDKLSLVYGLRYAEADQDGGLANLGAFGDTTPVASHEREDLTDAQMTRTISSKMLYRAGIVFKPVKGVSLYASYNDTYYPVNRIAQDRNGSLLPFPPETGHVTEVGLKSELFNGQVVLNADYYWNRRGPFIYYDAAANLFKEAPATPIDGFELDINAYLGKAWSAILTYGTAKTEGIAAVSVPRYSWSVWTKYEFQSEALKGLSIGLGADYMTDRSLFIPQLRGDARTLVNGMVSYKLNEHWSFALHGANLTDEFYKLSDSGGPDAIVPGEPRRVKFTATFRF